MIWLERETPSDWWSKLCGQMIFVGLCFRVKKILSQRLAGRLLVKVGDLVKRCNSAPFWSHTKLFIGIVITPVATCPNKIGFRVGVLWTDGTIKQEPIEWIEVINENKSR